MISQRAHSLLSELHKLLAGYESKDFREAAVFSPELREALTLLSTRTGASLPAEIVSSLVSTEETKSRKKNDAPSTPRRTSGPKFNDTREIRAFLIRSGQVENTNSIVALAKELNIPLKVNSKDGKERLLSRLSGSIASYTRDRRDSIARQISHLSPSQTLGWIDVLKSSR